MASTNVGLNFIKASPHFQQTIRHYGGTWKKVRRVQNPDIVKLMPTFEFVNSNMKKTDMVYVCGLGMHGALGLKKFHKPEVTDPDRLKASSALTPTFKRLGIFRSSDDIKDISCGYGFTIIAAQVKESSHSAFGFGLNNYSQIGYHHISLGRPLEVVTSPSAIVLPTKSPFAQVSCGRSHSLLLNEVGEVFTIGNNSFGQCARPIQRDEVYFGSMKSNLIEDLPRDIKQIECGQDHSLFLTDKGDLYSCGWGADGQTGLGHYENQHIPTKVKGDIENVKVVKVSSFADTVLALDDQGNVFGWGNSEYAQFRVLANSEVEQFNTPKSIKMNNYVPGKIIDIAAGGTMCAVVNDLGHVYVWGFGLLGKGPNVDQSSVPTKIPESLFGINVYNPNSKVVKIHASISHFGAITDTGDLYTWGRNSGSALGHAHGKDQYFPMKVDTNHTTIKKLSLGVDHSCVIGHKIC